MSKDSKEEMLKEIFIQTGGRPENPKIAEICARIADLQSSEKDKRIKELEEKIKTILYAMARGEELSKSLNIETTTNQTPKT